MITRNKYLAALCLFTLCGILVAGLWPFHHTRNQVTWLPGENGIAFGRHGVVVSAGAVQARGTGESGCSVEMWLRANSLSNASSLLSFYSSKHITVFQVRQSWADLQLRRRRLAESGRVEMERVESGEVLSESRPAFVTLSSGARGTALYMDGSLNRIFPRFHVSAADCSGQLVVGGSPRGGDNFSGRLLGLAVYHEELSASQVLRHFESWTKTGTPALAGSEEVVGVYPFHEHTGNVVHAAHGPGIGLYIPENFMVVENQFLLAPWKAFAPRWGYWEDVLINVGGFVPFGLFLWAYVSSRWTTRWATLVTVGLGLALSLTIEITQSYLPTRDSDLTDVITNTLGTLIGATFCRWVVIRLSSLAVTGAPASRNSRKKICMVAYTDYETDNRVRRYAEELTRCGDYVDVVALSREDALLGREEINGVNLHRIQSRKYDERRKWTYAWRLLRFLVASSIFLARRHRQLRYDLIHIHNVPDFLVFAAWFPKVTGAKLILDIHDIVPELFASKFKARGNSLYVRLLKIIEKVSAKFVDHVIVSNHLWQGTLISRSVPLEKCSVFLNNVDLALFYRHPRTRDDGKVIILFPGSFLWHQGLDIAIEAFARMKKRLPNAEFHLYGGGGGTEAALIQLAERLGVDGSVKFFGVLPMDRIAGVIANADLGVVPKRADSFGNEAYSTKIMEFMSQGVPVVVSRTKIDAYYFDDDSVRFFPSGDIEALANAMVEVIESKTLRDSLVKRGYEHVDQHNWDTRKKDYLSLVDSLTAETRPVSQVALGCAGLVKR